MVERCDYMNDADYTEACIREEELYRLNEEERRFEEAFAEEQYAKEQMKIEKINSIIKKDTEKENGVVFDSDTILADIMNEADFEISGLSQEIFKNYIACNDKESFEKLFYTLTGVSFEDYIDRCEKN